MAVEIQMVHARNFGEILTAHLFLSLLDPIF